MAQTSGQTKTLQSVGRNVRKLTNPADRAKMIARARQAMSRGTGRAMPRKRMSK